MEAQKILLEIESIVALAEGLALAQSLLMEAFQEELNYKDKARDLGRIPDGMICMPKGRADDYMEALYGIKFAMGDLWDRVAAQAGEARNN